MKKIFILLVFAISLIACSLESKPDTNVYHEAERTNDVYIVNGLRLRTVVIDSCEYLIGSRYEPSVGYGYLSHKGNCKYCAERRKHELNNKHK